MHLTLRVYHTTTTDLDDDDHRYRVNVGPEDPESCSLSRVGIPDYTDDYNETCGMELIDPIDDYILQAADRHLNLQRWLAAYYLSR